MADVRYGVGRWAFRFASRVLATLAVMACSGTDGTDGPAAPTAGQPILWSRLDAGRQFTCGVATDGRGYCWGEGWSAGLPPGNVVSPRQVNSGFRWSVIEAGGSLVCGVSTDRKIYCWGSWAGQLVLSPAPLRGDPGLVSISVGATHACGLAVDGIAYCWGDDGRGQLGIGAAYFPADSAVRVSGNLKFLSIRAGAESTCGIVVGGDVYCWGGSEFSGGATPSLAQRGFGFVSLAYGGTGGGRGKACAQDASGALRCFGFIPYEALPQPTPEILPASEAGVARQFDVGGKWASELDMQFQTHACLVGSTDTVACWGSNAAGQLGDGTTTDRDATAMIPQLVDVAQVTTGGMHTCAVTKSGTAYCWGQNREGQLGIGLTGTPATTPQLVKGISP